MTDCLFCKIIAGDIPSQKVYEDQYVYAFRDISPQAPVHVLIVPKAHLSGMNEMHRLEEAELAALLRAAQLIAAREGLVDSGYRLVTNCGPDACQSVAHLHFHVLGGKKMSERMD